MFKHSTPLISTMINAFILSDMIIYVSDFWFSLIVGIAYGLTTFIITISTGKYIYWFLPWDSMLSLYILIGIAIFSIVVTYFAAKIS